ncbi:hypothetical protein SAMD00019534_121050 [Acytostelium subglobosum LB1]|uniref:hypothetical protein n=1 Tax=Acytostelium subglobosum LB1 TaxID=1410327 RepID=UPI0006449C46|nr:hypothetical protein SAMD00019534_121050 [Acytostelium subglobosum LB1]GAM28929.1 hypothetical protein SAMD00019534_121050 [Acytostelium subglobosum LB1]|eukprot:XP_012748114.1 hypothetical protein SAMD00019534_121050 [Acytostelium subglobosum LB1]
MTEQVKKSVYTAVKSGDSTYSYAPGSPMITTHISEIQQTATENVQPFESKITEQSSKFFPGEQSASSSMDTTTTSTEGLSKTEALKQKAGNFIDKIEQKIGGTGSQTDSTAAGTGLASSTTEEATTGGHIPTASSLTSDKSTMVSETTTGPSSDTYYDGLQHSDSVHPTTSSGTEPHKPSTIMNVKGFIKEKVGHITKNTKMEEEGRSLEAVYQQQKQDYTTFAKK